MDDFLGPTLTVEGVDEIKFCRRQRQNQTKHQEDAKRVDAVAKINQETRLEQQPARMVGSLRLDDASTFGMEASQFDLAREAAERQRGEA